MKFIKLFEDYSNDDYITLKHLSSEFYIVKDKYNNHRFFIYDDLESLLKEKENDYKEKHIGEILFSNNWIDKMVKKDKTKSNINSNSWYLDNIWVNNKYVGKKLGFIFLKKVLEILNIKEFYLQPTNSSLKRWLNLGGKETGYYYHGYDHCPILKLNNI